MDSFKDDMMGQVMEGIIPKIMPMIKPALKKLSDFLGENKLIHVRNLNGSVTVFIIDKSKGDFNISKIDGNESLEIDPEAVEQVLSLDDFVTSILNGEFKGLKVD